MKATAEKKGGSGKSDGKGKIRRMTFEPAKNGFTSRIEREPKRNANGMMDFNREDAPTIHPNINHAARHLKNTFGGTAGPEPEPGEPQEPEEAAGT